jgi:hypothetical protein
MNAEDWVYYGITVVVIVLVVGSLAWLGYVMYFGPQIHAQPIATATMLPLTRLPTARAWTSTPRPTATRGPATVTPILPTATHKPMKTPVVLPPMPPPKSVVQNTMPAAAAAVTVEEEAYWKDLSAVGKNWLVAYFAMRDLMVELHEDGRLLTDGKWQEHVEALFMVMDSACRGLGRLSSPPARLEEIYEGFMRACEGSNRGRDLVGEGIEKRNVEKIGEGWAEILLGFSYLDEIRRSD